MAVGLGVELRVRVGHRPGEREGRHERDALAHAGWQVGVVELVEPLTRATRLHVVAPAFADAGKDEATRVVQRPGTHRPGPASIVPRDADGDVVGRQATGGGEACHNQPPCAAVFRPAGGCFQPSALAPEMSWRSQEPADVVDFEERDRGLLSVGVEDLPNVSIAPSASRRCCRRTARCWRRPRVGTCDSAAPTPSGRTS